MDALASFGTPVPVRGLNITRPEHPAPSQEKERHEQNQEVATEVALVTPVEPPEAMEPGIGAILETRVSRIEMSVVSRHQRIEQVQRRLRGEGGLAEGAVHHPG